MTQRSSSKYQSGQSSARTWSRRGGTSSRGSSSSHKQQQAPRETTDHLPDATLFVPPASMFALGGLGLLIGIGCNLWQGFTTFSAFQSMIIAGHIYQSMSRSAQAAALPIINIICALIATSFQMAILYLVFRIDHDWKKQKAQGGSSSANVKASVSAAKHTAIEVVQHVPLVVVWGMLGFVADTIGDYTFIELYVDNGFVIFMYASSLYASSTVMLAAAIEYLWAGKVAWAKWRSFLMGLHPQALSSQKPDDQR